MERIIDGIKVLISILILFSVIAAFSSCETKREEKIKDTSIQDTFGKEEEKDEGWRKSINEESETIRMKLDSLRVKAKSKGTKVENEVNKFIDKVNLEREKAASDTSRTNRKENWEKFKEGVKNSIDSLEKKL
jgi:hypothetical protein